MKSWQVIVTPALLLTLSGCGAQTARELPRVGGANGTLAAPVVAALGEIRPVRTVDLIFPVAGIVSSVNVKEGDHISKGQVLAVLDTRPFDQRVDQASAALEVAAAQQSGLDDAPRAADVSSAEAQVRQAQIAVQQARLTQTQDVRLAAAAVSAAESGVQATKDRLSAAKTQADNQVQLAAQALTAAQARFAQATSNWQYVQDTGVDPIVPHVQDPRTGKVRDNKLSDGAKENYYSQLVQAEAAMHQAEQQVGQVQVAADAAHQAEVTGIQQAEDQLTQAQATLDKLQLPANVDRVAAAQAQLNLSAAARARLNPDPRDSQRAVATGGLHNAQAALDQAQLNREYASLRAPWDAVVADVGVVPGDTVGGAGKAAVRLLDLSELRFEVPVSDAVIGQIHLDEPASIALDALAGTTLSGHVSYIAPSATSVGSSRSYLVRVSLDNSENLRPGMVGRVQFK